jgi:glycerol-1-phosphate dehydrogenase [NAD(P)+]
MLKNTKISRGLAINADTLISELGFSGEKLLFISDEKIWKNCQKFFNRNFLKKIDKVLLLKNPKADDKTLKEILIAAKSCDLIIGLGSGTINDLCKYSAAQTKTPYAIFASAASMNGYLSKNASITILGHKKTLPATLPIAVFCDLEILSSAPIELTKAGIGDSLCFYSCWFDWYLSNKVFGTKFDKKPFELLESKMSFFVQSFKNFGLDDERFLKVLIEILLLSGRGMTMAGGSYPASQSEHLIAHAITMKYPEISEKVLHGAQIAVTTLTSAKLQKDLPTLDAASLIQKIKSFTITKSSKKPLDGMVAEPAYMKKIEKFFGKEIALQCKKEYEQKILTAEEFKKIDQSLQKNWAKIKKDLQKIHLDELRLKAIFMHFEIDSSVKSIGLSEKEYQECVAHAKFIRNRFTCLDLV